jgi:ribosomal protein S18 acetylase RimI-like enzyme
MIFDRGQGIGTKVIEDVVSKNKKDYDLIYCYVEKDNSGAIRFYKRLGKVYKDLNSKGEHLVTLYDNGKYNFE